MEDNGQHTWVSNTYGKSFRDELAIVAMKEIIASDQFRNHCNDMANSLNDVTAYTVVANMAYSFADAMIAEREKKK